MRISVLFRPELVYYIRGLIVLINVVVSGAPFAAALLTWVGVTKRPLDRCIKNHSTEPAPARYQHCRLSLVLIDLWVSYGLASPGY